MKKYILTILLFFQICYSRGQISPKINSFSLFANPLLSQAPSKRGHHLINEKLKSYSYRVGLETNVAINRKNVSFITIGIYYFKDYYKANIADSIFVFELKKKISYSAIYTEDYNLIETPLGYEHNIRINKNLDLLLSASLNIGWSWNSRNIRTFTQGDSSILHTYYQIFPRANFPKPSSLRVMGGVGVKYKFASNWSIILQPNYMLGLESIFDFPPSRYIYSRIPIGSGSTHFINARLGIRKQF